MTNIDRSNHEAMARAVFLDRDGVIVQDIGYISKWDKKLLIPGSVEATKILNENNFKVVVITNQAGVAKGYYTEEDVILFNRLMIKELAKKGAKIDAIHYCPHHLEAKVERYRTICDCRKPKPGMLKKAEKELNIDLKRSFMIGDKKSDIDTGNIVGCTTILVSTGHGMEELKKYDIKYDFIANDLYNAVKYIVK